MGAHGDAARFRPLGQADRQGVIWAAAASLVLVVHGIAHLVGTTQAFDAANGGQALAYLGGRDISPFPAPSGSSASHGR